uniref:Uncharacterized protein n=1 Tax=Scylla paramamosain TaxID=85552 RepID=D2DT03_SCYPA|nr:hypothetical protein [Scylla paramamosain]
MQEKELVYHNLGSIICSSISVRGHCSVNCLCDFRQAPSWPQSFPEPLNTFPIRISSTIYFLMVFSYQCFVMLKNPTSAVT